MPRVQTFMNQFRALSRTEKVFAVALGVQAAYLLVQAATGFQMPGRDLVRLVFVVATIVFLVRSFPRMVRRLLWRVRHRLLVTGILVGVVPIVLICALVAESLFILMGQVVGYMTTTEISRQSELIRSTAYALAWSATHRAPSVALPVLAETFVRETSELRHARNTDHRY